MQAARAAPARCSHGSAARELRTIASTRIWMKNYTICSALTRNPKTPVAISMNLISRLNDRDMKMLAIDRNVPEVLRLTARKKLSDSGR